MEMTVSCKRTEQCYIIWHGSASASNREITLKCGSGLSRFSTFIQEIG
jgi:hypothetical protein